MLFLKYLDDLETELARLRREVPMLRAEIARLKKLLEEKGIEDKL